MLMGTFPDHHSGDGDRWFAGDAKKTVPESAGTFPTHGGLFVGLLFGVILIVGGLTFFPALAARPDRRAPRDDLLADILRSAHDITGTMQVRNTINPRAGTLARGTERRPRASEHHPRHDADDACIVLATLALHICSQRPHRSRRSNQDHQTGVSDEPVQIQRVSWTLASRFLP